jgi:hypothetical protein
MVTIVFGEAGSGDSFFVSITMILESDIELHFALRKYKNHSKCGNVIMFKIYEMKIVSKVFLSNMRRKGSKNAPLRGIQVVASRCGSTAGPAAR